MALMEEGVEPREDVASWFFTAQDGSAPTPEQLEVQRRIAHYLRVSASILNQRVADSREKSLALTKMQEALMWAGKAIFS